MATPFPDAAGHTPVLPGEILDVLSPKHGDVYVDATAGRGGHAVLVAGAIGASGTVVLNDLDPGNLEHAAAEVAKVASGPRVVTVLGNFAGLPRRMEELGLAADLVLADLGFSSTQVDDAERGFSFMRDGPLDMRLDPRGPLTAAQLVATASEAELTDIFRTFGEERHAKFVARRVVEARREAPIEGTLQLAEIVRGAIARASRGEGAEDGIHPATRVFQALRIAVNDEMGNLEAFLDTLGTLPRQPVWLRPGARVAVVSFHSLEDRRVKHAFADVERMGLGRILTGKPVTASDQEMARNPRARSAKLRAVRLSTG